jgi:hypothetical protein
MNDQSDIYLKNIPVVKENLVFETNDQLVSIVSYQDRGIQKFLRKFKFKIPGVSKIELDKFSSFIFLQINGERNIYEIGQVLKKEYDEEIEPLYERLLIFLEFIKNQKKWITYKTK